MNKLIILLTTLFLTYACVAGKVPAPVDLIVAPGSVSANDVTVIWHKPEQYKSIKKYHVLLNGKNIGSTSACNYRLTGLLPDTDYNISVRAEDKNALLSDETVLLKVKTKPASTVLNIEQFGAKGDGVTMNTKSIQQAIDQCPANGTVLIPKGIFLTGALHLKSNMTLLIGKDGVLQGSKKADDYLPMIRNRFEGWEMETFASLLNAGKLNKEGGYNVENLSVRGEGTIAGGGAELSKEMIAAKGMRGRGRLICLMNSQNVEIQGLQIKDSPCWTIHYIYSKNISCHDLDIKSDVANGDGIDPDSSEDGYIFNCRFANSDDCIAIKSGKNPEGYYIGRPTRNIQVTSCDFVEGHGISIGSEMSGGISDILVRDCKAGNLIYGMQIKGTKDRGGLVENIVVKDCFLRKISILTKLPYNNDGESAPVLPVFKGFEFSGIDMTEAESGQTIININGFSDSLHYTNKLLFKDIQLPDRTVISVSECKDLVFENVKTRDGSLPVYKLDKVFSIKK